MLSNGASAEPARLEPLHDEQELVRRAQLGSAAAFEQLVLARGPALERFLLARLRNESDARDALQETLVAAWQALPRLRQRDRFWPWLVGIAAHKAADVARRRTPLAEGGLELVVDTAGDPDERARVRELWAVVQSLPPVHRDVLLLRYLLQLSEEEVAAALGIRVGTVKSRTARARGALMELIA
jgi:RNA polymerase sigma-70 factor, ECF subfamily